MRVRVPVAITAAVAVALLIISAPAGADHGTRPHTPNLRTWGHSPHPASFSDPAPVRHINSDLAFWGQLTYQGNYDGFRIIDITHPNNPVELSHQRCNGDRATSSCGRTFWFGHGTRQLLRDASATVNPCP